MKIIFGFLFLTALALTAFAQPGKLTKEQFGEQGNALLNAGKQREALALVDAHPEFADEADGLYIRSIAYTELRDYKTADIYFQKQFDMFRNSGDSARADGDDIVKTNPPSKENNDLASMMYGAAMISYASADLVNSLRATAFDKNGMPANMRKPKDLANYDAMLLAYKDTAIASGLLKLKLAQFKDALSDLNTAVRLAPDDPETYAARAKLYRKTKRIAFARADEVKAGKLRKK
jgi:tetratricopeptide (TPR) repeat protein